MNLGSELQKNEILGGMYYKIEYYFLLSLRQEIDLLESVPHLIIMYT